MPRTRRSGVGLSMRRADLAGEGLRHELQPVAVAAAITNHPVMSVRASVMRPSRSPKPAPPDAGRGDGIFNAGHHLVNARSALTICATFLTLARLSLRGAL